MAVSETIVLPNQPSSGRLTRIPLGGDGFYAPTAAYAVTNFALTGDVSGGAVTHLVTMDNRFCSLVSWISFTIAQATAADADFRVSIGGTTGIIPVFVENNAAVATSAVVNALTVGKTIVPPPAVLPGGGDPGIIAVRTLNVDTDVVTMNAMIYIFNIRAREKTPMGPLLWARGSS